MNAGVASSFAGHNLGLSGRRGCCEGPFPASMSSQVNACLVPYLIAVHTRQQERGSSVEQAAFDRLQELKKLYAELLMEEEVEQLEGWEVRAKGLLDAINGIQAVLLREATRR
jgi:hypothetical protein